MVKELVDYEVMMKGHLKEEEDISLLLTRAYFTQSELAPKIQEIIGHGPKVCAEHEGRSIVSLFLCVISHTFFQILQIEMGSFIDSCGVEKFRNGFMVQEGIPFFVWYIDFNSRHKFFLKQFKNPAEALKSGKEPAPEIGWLASMKASLLSLFGAK